MHRTQVLLEAWQYETLKAMAQRQRRSISDLLRTMLAERLAPLKPPARRGLEAMRGIGREKTVRGRDHDRVLYGARRS